MASTSESSNISTIRTVIMKALTDPRIYCGFDQIKEKLSKPLSEANDGETMLRTLDLFSYGTYQQYVNANDGHYQSLTEAQLFKLRQLTVISLVQQSCLKGDQVGILPYEDLKQEVGLDEVEELLISCIYAGWIAGKLCQKQKCLVISSADGPPCQARDVDPSQTAFLLQTMSKLTSRLDVALTNIESSRTQVQKRKDEHSRFWKQMEERKFGPVGGMEQWGSGGGNSRRGSSARSVKRSRAPEPAGRS